MSKLGELRYMNTLTHQYRTRSEHEDGCRRAAASFAAKGIHAASRQGPPQQRHGRAGSNRML